MSNISIIILLSILSVSSSNFLDQLMDDSGPCTKGETRSDMTGKFIYLCKDNLEEEIIACITPLRDEIKIGESKRIGSISYKCSKGPNGEAHLEMLLAAISQPEPVCNYEGKTYKVGQKFQTPNGRFIMNCGHDLITVHKCVTDDKQEIGVGESLAIKSEIHSCIRNGNVVRYEKK